MSPKSFSVEAFVLRLRPLGEADRIVHLFSRERGKLHAVAKGARRPQSKFGARLDFFSRSQLALHPGRSFHIITAAKTTVEIWDKLVDPDVFAALSYVAEVVDGLCEPDLPVPELYELLCAVGDAIARGTAVANLMPAFDLGALGALGLMPEFDACARCGAPLGKRPLAGGRARLSPDAGGLVCARCFESELAQQTRAGIINLTTAELTALREMRALSMPALIGSSNEHLSLPPERLRRLTRATHAFVEHHLGRSSRALKASAHSAPTPRQQAAARA